MQTSVYDNAVTESFFSNFKNGLIHHCDFITSDQARAAIFDYIITVSVCIKCSIT